MDKIYTVTELAIYLSLSEKTILRKLNSRELEGSKIGHQWRITQSQLDEYLNKTSNSKKNRETN